MINCYSLHQTRLFHMRRHDYYKLNKRNDKSNGSTIKSFCYGSRKEKLFQSCRSLYMTQPAVSQYIRTLEENIGVRLLDRTNKYVNLNQAGEIVYHHAKEIIGLHTR